MQQSAIAGPFGPFAFAVSAQRRKRMAAALTSLWRQCAVREWRNRDRDGKDGWSAALVNRKCAYMSEVRPTN